MQIALQLPIKKEEKVENEYDVIVIGLGPAGLTSLLYLARYKLKSLGIAEEIGGTLNEIAEIEDYPGFIKITGSQLKQLFINHVNQYKEFVDLLEDKVIDIKKDGKVFIVKTANGYSIKTKTIILAMGSRRRTLNVGEEKFIGRGVSYCAECDAGFFKNKIVAVVGGGNTAFHDALVLSKYAKEVYIIHRRDKFRADPIYIDLAKKEGNIKFLMNKIVINVDGKDRLEKILLQDTKTNERLWFKVDGLFIAIGLIPNNELAKKLGVNLDEKGKIIVDNCMKTNIPGVFAAGDITNSSCNFMQIVTSNAEGAIAARSAYEYIMKNFVMTDQPTE